MTQSTHKKGLSIGTSFVLIAIVIGLAMIPFFLAPNAEFSGADAAAAVAILANYDLCTQPQILSSNYRYNRIQGDVIQVRDIPACRSSIK